MGCFLSGMQTQLRLGDERMKHGQLGYIIPDKGETAGKCTERKVSDQILWNVQRVISESAGLPTSPKEHGCLCETKITKLFHSLKHTDPECSNNFLNIHGKLS